MNNTEHDYDLEAVMDRLTKPMFGSSSDRIPEFDPHPDNHFEELIENMDIAGYDAWLSKLENVELELLYKEARLHAEYDRLGREIEKMSSIEVIGSNEPLQPCVSEKKRRIALYMDLKRLRNRIYQVRELHTIIDRKRMDHYTTRIVSDAEDNETYL